jgi:hypothetical protein
MRQSLTNSTLVQMVAGLFAVIIVASCDGAGENRQRPEPPVELDTLTVGHDTLAPVATDPFADSSRFLLRDSSGVHIVESLDSLWRGDGWWVDTSASLLSIGVALGDTLYELHAVTGAIRLSSGAVAISEESDAGAWIKVFDTNGRFRFRVGSRGSGAGQFMEITGMLALPGDSLMVFDQLLSRASVFAPGTGRFVRTSLLYPGRPAAPTELARLSSGELVRSLVVPGATPVSLDMQPFVRRDTLVLLRMGVSTSLAERLLALPDEEKLVVGDVGLAHRFTPGAFWSTAGDSIVAGSSDRVELGVYDANGSLKRVVRAALLDVPLEQDSIAALLAEWNSPSGGNRANPYAAQQLTYSPFPVNLPRFRGIQVDTDRNIWLKIPTSDDRIVFDRFGRLLGTVAMPARRVLRAIGDDWMLFSRTDRLGVQYVELLQLVKQ